MSERCPKCGANALARSLYTRNAYYCFTPRGGCGALIPDLTIAERGLTRGIALEPYHCDLQRHGKSFFGYIINQVKYKHPSDEKKLALIDKAVKEIQKRGVVEELTKDAHNLLIVSVPPSKYRTVQPVYEIAKK